MATTRKTRDRNKGDIVSNYMEYVSNLSELPNIDDFCSSYSISAQNVAQYFDTLQEIEMSIWAALMEQAIVTIHYDEQYLDYTNQEKLLSLLYTFFENLTLNREYLLKNLFFNPSAKNKRNLFSKRRLISSV